jgi:hypothetical protein
MTWIFHPLAFGALAVVTSVVMLYLMATIKVRTRSAPAGRERHLHAELGELKKRMDELAARAPAPVADVERAGEGSDFESAAALPLRSGINLARRSQALRLYRRGETPEQIASSLMVPTGEVRLLLKVHRLVMEQMIAGPYRPGLKSRAESADTFSSAESAPQGSSKPI